MKKKSLSILFISFLILNIISIQILRAENIPSTMPIVPGLGQINEETGLPDSFEKFRQVAGNLSEEEGRKEYLYREWTKLLGNTTIIGPVLFYTNDFFSSLNPFWNFIFQMDFAWSWEFIFCLVIFTVLVIVISMPLAEFVNMNKIAVVIMALVISVLIGKMGVIKQAADTLTFAVKNIWLAILCLILAILVTFIYSAILAKLGKDARKNSEEEELKRAKESIKAHGEYSEKALKEMSED